MSMSPRATGTARAVQPMLESDLLRSEELGYEDVGSSSWIRCLAHGFPSTLARWHCHEEYELHLIVATSGKAFVGDWIGEFGPGHVVLCGPRLPHNWISLDLGNGIQRVDRRDLVVQFAHEPLAAAARGLPELEPTMNLLARARHGIEFFGVGAEVERLWAQVRGRQHLSRLAALLELLDVLGHCRQTRLLSSVQMEGATDSGEIERISQIVGRISTDSAEPVSLAECAQGLNMSESRFSRIFRRCTGHSFTDFVNRVRIGNACHLLAETDAYVTDICYRVGFNNVANFNRRFLAIKGMTPTEYRRQSEQRSRRPD